MLIESLCVLTQGFYSEIFPELCCGKCSDLFFYNWNKFFSHGQDADLQPSTSATATKPGIWFCTGFPKGSKIPLSVCRGNQAMQTSLSAYKRCHPFSSLLLMNLFKVTIKWHFGTHFATLTNAFLFEIIIEAGYLKRNYEFSSFQFVNKRKFQLNEGKEGQDS